MLLGSSGQVDCGREPGLELGFGSLMGPPLPCKNNNGPFASEWWHAFPVSLQSVGACMAPICGCPFARSMSQLLALSAQSAALPGSSAGSTDCSESQLLPISPDCCRSLLYQPVGSLSAALSARWQPVGSPVSPYQPLSARVLTTFERARHIDQTSECLVRKHRYCSISVA